MKINHQKIPDYKDPQTGGSMIRAACWLASVVGEGNVFTKEQLREALPGVAQIDRRVRDLRKYGWVIDEARVGAGLVANQQRLTKIGAFVWDKSERDKAAVPVISAKVRDEVFFRDGNACRRCGISAGEPFDDDRSVTARLTAGHLYPDSLGSKATVADLITTCQRCNESLQQVTLNYANSSEVISRMSQLDPSQMERLSRRILTGLREIDQVDSIWQDFRQLAGVDRELVWEHVVLGLPEKPNPETSVAFVPEQIRDEVFSRDEYSCVRCGISAGELFDDSPGLKAKLAVSFTNPKLQAVQSPLVSDLVTLCQRCISSNNQFASRNLDPDQLIVRIRGLGKDLRLQLLKRIESNIRPADKVDKIWRGYKQLQPIDQQTVFEELSRLVKD